MLLAAAAMLMVACAFGGETTVVDLVQKHLASIGTDQARATAKNRVVEGTLRFRVLSLGGSVHMASSQLLEGSEQSGKEVFVSEGSKLVALLKLTTPSYHGERFVSDGRNNMVAEMRPGTYSDLGELIHIHDEILTEGLWGGTLSTGWALEHLEERHAKLKDKGKKSIDGREFRVLQYVPAKHSDLEIELYFEPETMRHVMTRYLLSISPQMGSTDADTARQMGTHFEVEEQFLNFEKQDELQLPRRWVVRLTENVPRENRTSPGNLAYNNSARIYRGGSRTAAGRAGVGSAPSPDLKPFAMEFDVVASSISHNVSLDPKNFEVK